MSCLYISKHKDVLIITKIKDSHPHFDMTKTHGKNSSYSLSEDQYEPGLSSLSSSSQLQQQQVWLPKMIMRN
jgi:hypothetical protein